jgi:hypothetical protein
MPQDRRATEKKPYSSPRFIVLDEKIAKATLKDAGDPGDQTMQRMPLWPEKESKIKEPGAVRRPPDKHRPQWIVAADLRSGLTPSNGPASSAALLS